MLDKTLTPDRYKGIIDRLEADNQQIGEALQKLNADYTQKFKGIENLAKMALNIHQTYKEADPLLKRQYLGLFFQKVLVRNKKVVGALPSRQIKPLIKKGKISVRVVSNWLPNSAVMLYQLFPQDLLAQMKIKLEILKELLGSESQYETVEVKNGQFCRFAV